MAPVGLNGFIKINSGSEDIKTFKKIKVLDILRPVFKSIIVKSKSAGSCNIPSINFNNFVIAQNTYLMAQRIIHHTLFNIAKNTLNIFLIIALKHPYTNPHSTVVRYQIWRIKPPTNVNIILKISFM